MNLTLYDCWGLTQYTQRLGVRAQIGVERSKHVTQNVFVVGWGIAALTALHVSSVEPLSGTICLGLPLIKRSKQLKHVMSDIKCPVLFIVGKRHLSRQSCFGRRARIRIFY